MGNRNYTDLKGERKLTEKAMLPVKKQVPRYSAPSATAISQNVTETDDGIDALGLDLPSLANALFAFQLRPDQHSQCLSPTLAPSQAFEEDSTLAELRSYFSTPLSCLSSKATVRAMTQLLEEKLQEKQRRTLAYPAGMYYQSELRGDMEYGLNSSMSTTLSSELLDNLF